MPVAEDPRLRDVLSGHDEGGRPSVCIVSSEIVGPSKNGGIGTAMTGLAEHLAHSGCRVTILYTGGIPTPEFRLDKWKAHFAGVDIDLAALSLEQMSSLAGPVRDHGFGTPYLVYEYLVANSFDVVHFNEYGGEGSLCLVAKRLGLAFRDTRLVVGLHGPSEWVLELNQIQPSALVHSAKSYSERLSVNCADLVWSPSRYLLAWARDRGFVFAGQTCVQQYCLPGTLPPPQLGRSGAVKEIVFFGRLEGRKGLPLFCDAMDRLADTFVAQDISVTFLGKAGTCAGVNGRAYVERRARAWKLRVSVVTSLGQPEALAYLRSGEKLAVMASPADNSPCTVYEALAWGIPFLAARVGGIPELVHESDHARVLFDHTLNSLCNSLRGALDEGGWVAAPSETQEEIRQVWSAFHATQRHAADATPAPQLASRVVAIVDGGSEGDNARTLQSLQNVPAIEHIIVLKNPKESTGQDSHSVDDELSRLTDEHILLIHAGIELRSDLFAEMLTALEGAGIDGLQPAAEVIGGRRRVTVVPLGGDPVFALFEGATFTGGLLVRGSAFRRACQGRSVDPLVVFSDLADCCMTRGLQIWPYPKPVLMRSSRKAPGPSRSLESRLKALNGDSEADRLLMATCRTYADASGRPRRGRMFWALWLTDLGLAGAIRQASRAWRNT